MDHIERFDHHDWGWVMLGTLSFGAWAMRGFGSRKTY
jgi:hypothetical protein